jgi:CheY-like chemotaxis protein
VGIPPGRRGEEIVGGRDVGRILICDDHRDICELVGKLFRASGHEGICAFSGEELLVLLHSAPADLLLLDMMLPGMTGLDCLRRVRAIPRTVYPCSFTRLWPTRNCATARARRGRRV